MSDAKVLWHFTMSLDGFMAGPNHSMDFLAHASIEPEVAQAVAQATGAVLAGRRAHDVYAGTDTAAYGGAWACGSSS